MPKARPPRPRVLSAVFGAYFLLVILLAYVFSPQVAGYVDPAATFWICASFVLLGALALAGLGAGALARARTLDARLDQLEAVRRRVREIQGPILRRQAEAPRPRGVVNDSGSADVEVEALLDGLAESADGNGVEPEPGEPEPAPSAIDDLLKADTWEIERVRKARDALAVALMGPAVAAIALVGLFAPLLPAADGMLLSDLSLNAFLGAAGLGVLVGLPAYAGAAFRQLRPWAA